MRIPSALGVVFLLSTPGAVALELSGAISREAARLLTRVPESERDGPIGKELTRALQDLSAIGRSLETGRRLLALEKLFASYDFLESAAFWVENRNLGGESAAFEALWSSVGERVEAGLSEAEREALRSRPAFVRAQAESALNRASPHLHAARLYVKAGLLGGLFYLGSARSGVGLARLCSSLPVAARGAAPRFRRLAEVESELSARAIETYGAPGASTAHHPEFIRLDSALKDARRLLQDGRLEGAVSSLLEARYRLGLISPSPSPGSPLDDFASRIQDPAVDHSIAGALRERAMALAESGNEEDRVRAAVLLQEVIPFYFSLLED